MSTAQSQGEKLFFRCFTKEQLAYLDGSPEFIHARHKIENLKGAMQVVELGDKLLRHGSSSNYAETLNRH